MMPMVSVVVVTVSAIATAEAQADQGLAHDRCVVMDHHRSRLVHDNRLWGADCGLMHDHRGLVNDDGLRMNVGGLLDHNRTVGVGR